METEFDITLNSSDMYRFSMYHAYTGTQGIISIVIAALCFFVSVKTRGSVEMTYTILYAVFGVVILIYIPVQLYLRSKRQIMASEVLRRPLHYRVDSEGVHTSQGEAAADLPWDQVYKMVSTRYNILIYSNRVNAFIIPKSQIEKEYGVLLQLAGGHLPKYRYKVK